jgi:hypothetical protein
MNPFQVLNHAVSAIEQSIASRALKRTGRDMMDTNMALQSPLVAKKPQQSFQWH